LPCRYFVILRPFTEKVNGSLIHSNPSVQFYRAAHFDQEIDAVSVRKAKNIANEVDRKRTNRITLLFASSIGFSPFPGPGGSGAIIIPEIDLFFPINSGKGVISDVNGKRIKILNGYDSVCGGQKCNSRFQVFISKVRKQAIQADPGGILPKGSRAFP
jgi:hypothetical protein